MPKIAFSGYKTCDSRRFVKISTCEIWYEYNTFPSYRRSVKTEANVAKHFIDNSYSGTFKNLEILHVENKGFRLSLREAFEIQTAVTKGFSFMNDQLDIYSSPFFPVVKL